MARWARRIPETTKARIQTQNWLASLGRPPSFATILRLARICELRGWQPSPSARLYPERDESAFGTHRVSHILWSLHPSYIDYTNLVLRELQRRHAERERQARPRMTGSTLEEWIASELELPKGQTVVYATEDIIIKEPM